MFKFTEILMWGILDIKALIRSFLRQLYSTVFYLYSVES